jgi:type I restriction enzyme S subunit
VTEGWRPSTWGEEVSLEYGKAIRGYKEAIAPYRVFGSNGPIGWTESPLAKGPGIILGRKGAYRGVHFSHDPFFVIDTAYYVKPKTDLEMRWLYYAIIHHKLGEIDDGSPIPSTTRSAVYVRDFDVPPLPEQRAIAATLGALDDKIELNRRMNETLEAMARALFRDWFVDFGPTRAKMAGTTPYLSPALWSLFPDRLDDAGKPEGWEVGNMSDLFTLQRGFDLPSQKRREGLYPILAASGPSGFHESYMVKGPGVTTGRSGVLGRVFFVHGDFWPLNTSLWVKEYKRATPRYAYFFLNLIDLESFNAGSAVPTLNRNHIHGLPAVLSPQELIVAFDQVAESLMARQRQNEIENETLAQTRDLLLPRLMSGELRVAVAGRAVEAVL